MPAVRDPREIITPESFTVAPELLGLPLARPARRAAAMLLDLVLIALLVNAGGVLFGIAAAWVFLRVSGRKAGSGLLRRSWRLALRSAAALILFVSIVSAWGFWRRDPPRAEAPAASAGTLAGLAALGDAISYRNAHTEAEAEAAGRRLAERLREQGLEPREVREVLEAVAREEGQPWAGRVARAAARTDTDAPGAARPAADSLLHAYAAALASGDSGTVAALRPQAAAAVAGDTIAALQGRIRRLERRAESLRAERDAAREERGILSFLRTAAEDLGLGLGWSGLYFTAFLALWRGQTPGKRLLRIRVVRLDGKPMTFWAAFERFGGYAASLVTGLLGFVQILWDRNRQGMHDKITETVVIRL